jgi:DNA-binding transcriptional MerR regulator
MIRGVNTLAEEQTTYAYKRKDLDEEWLYLISEAKRCGLSLEEVRSFLQKPKKAVNPPHR